jgi:MarR family transcriptional regulator, organic hydroperoxide resistance regulator
MKENEIDKVTAHLYYLLPLLQKKIYRPCRQEQKSIISPMQIRSMVLLREKGSITMTELAKEMLIAKPQLTPIIDKLIDSDLVERKNEKDDRRIIKISLTSSGHELLEVHKNEMLELLKKKIDFFDIKDLASLDEALDRVINIINKLP